MSTQKPAMGPYFESVHTPNTEIQNTFLHDNFNIADSPEH
jgi:hypothetical protein